MVVRVVELIHQRDFQEADMTCAMDWYYPGGRDAPSIFYDVWISRKCPQRGTKKDSAPETHLAQEPDLD